jgi:hypothetical protein
MKYLSKYIDNFLNVQMFGDEIMKIYLHIFLKLKNCKISFRVGGWDNKAQSACCEPLRAEQGTGNESAEERKHGFPASRFGVIFCKPLKIN